MAQFLPAYIIAYSNSDFTNPHELVLADDPRDCRSEYTHMGVKYGGLETSRHKACCIDEQNQTIRYNHHDHHWLRIGFRERSLITGLRVSTRWFTGNQVRAISVALIDELSATEVQVLGRTALQPDEEHCFCFEAVEATEALVQLYYEGGIARINFFGQPARQPLPVSANLLEQAAISHVSNDHYGHPATAVHGNRKEMYMSGWESARTGFGERVVFHLKQPSQIREVVVDTYLHRLNAPLSCHLFGWPAGEPFDPESDLPDAPRWMLRFDDGSEIVPANFQEYMLGEQYLRETVSDPARFEIALQLPEGAVWQPVLPFEALRPDTYHRFFPETDVLFSHLLYMHYPNGGIHGLKVFGTEQSTI